MTKAKRRGRRNGALWLILAGLLAGCTSAEVRAPLALRLDVDRPEYRIGDPVVVTMRLENHSEDRVGVLSFDSRTLKFLYGTKGLGVRLHREPVSSSGVEAAPREIAPGEAIERRFLFTRLTEKEGSFGLLVSFKGAVRNGQVIEDTVFAEPKPFKVTEEIGLRRDPVNGLVLKDQAIELAKKAAGGEVTEVRAVLMPLGKTGLFTWVVMLETKAEPGKPSKHMLQVDAYRGTVRPLELKDASPSQSEP